MDHPSNEAVEPGLSVASVARRVGVAPDTLRTWDRRYGMGPRQHTTGKHRRYTSEDVARIEIMCRLVQDGVMPGEAARVALNADVAQLAQRKTGLHLVTEDSELENEKLSDSIVDLDNPINAIRGLTRAANMLDADACQHRIARLLESRGVLWTWDNVLVPVLVAAGEKWEATGEGVEVEHLLAEVITREFNVVASSIDEPVNVRPVLLASAPHELHTLPMYAISAALAQHQVESRVLGARTPIEALTAACRKLNPSAVVVWSQSRGTADNSVWTSLDPQRPAPMKLAIGPGWTSDLPDDVESAETLADTLIQIMKVSGH